MSSRCFAGLLFLAALVAAAKRFAVYIKDERSQAVPQGFGYGPGD
jgi:hypothetical protein